MSLDIGTALREGFDRTTKRNALLLMVAFFLLGLASTVATQSLLVGVGEVFAELLRQQGQQLQQPQQPQQSQQPEFDPDQFAAQFPLALPLPIFVAAVAALVVTLLAEALSLVAARTFVSDATDTIPGEFLRRRIAFATLNVFIGGIVVGVVIALPLVVPLVLAGVVAAVGSPAAALVVGGIGLLVGIPVAIFLALSFFFVTQEIAIEDTNFVDAMAGAWRLSKGDRIELLALVIILIVIAILANVPTLVLGYVGVLSGGSQVIEFVTPLVSLVITAVVSAFSAAVAARAYVQVRAGREGEEDEDEDEGVGALGPDDIPES